jgi:hypothetical protein
MSRAVPATIKIFRDHDAMSEANAQSAESLGLKPKSLFKLSSASRDYKPRALLMLYKMEIVKSNMDGELYLNEEALARSSWKGL